MVSQAVLSDIRERESGGSYGWIIDVDHTHDPEVSERSDSGTVGPYGIPTSLRERLAVGEGMKFRMHDGDGELLYSGRLVGLVEDDDEEYGPLDDFGGPNAGCIDIYYWYDDITRFEAPNQEKYAELRLGHRIKIPGEFDWIGETRYVTAIIRDNEDQTGGWVSL